LVGAAVLLSSQAGSLNPVLGLWLLAGVGNAVAVISYNSLLQERTPDNFRGRVVAASEAVLDASLIVGALLAGSLGAMLGARGAFALSGAGFLLAAALARALLVARAQEPADELQEPEAAPGAPAPARS